VKRASPTSSARSYLPGRSQWLRALWAASDVYTLNLMQHFYRYIAAGEDKGSALRHAQLDLIKQFADQAMPFYWAGFIVVGDGSRSIPILLKSEKGVTRLSQTQLRDRDVFSSKVRPMLRGILLRQ
jgi:CHAT domain